MSTDTDTDEAAPEAVTVIVSVVYASYGTCRAGELVRVNVF